MGHAWMRFGQVQLLVNSIVLSLVGCAALSPVNGIPASLVPSVLEGKRRADMQEIDYVRLRQDPPEKYLLGPRDVLGIYIDTILGEKDQPMPIQFSPDGKIPSIGYPVPIREDGTISLPWIEPIKVEGLTVGEVEAVIRDAYNQPGKQILLPGGDNRVIVSLMQPRTYQVLVIREELGNTKRGTGYRLDLAAYQNDVLTAMTLTGGLPGLDVKNEIIILRGTYVNALGRDQVLSQLWYGCDECGFVKPGRPDDPNVVRIPLRFDPFDPPSFTQEDIILRSGDIVLIESRETEFFYTGGVLGNGQLPLPRDYDLDILAAISIAGGGTGGGGFGSGNQLYQSGGASSYGVFPPTQVVIIRTIPGRGQIPIKVDLKRAMLDSSERIIIQPGDVVILTYKPPERIANMILGSFGINLVFTDLFRGRN